MDLRSGWSGCHTPDKKPVGKSFYLSNLSVDGLNFRFLETQKEVVCVVAKRTDLKFAHFVG